MAMGPSHQQHDSQPNSCVYVYSRRSLALNADADAKDRHREVRYLWIPDARSPDALRIAAYIRNEPGCSVDEVRRVESVADFVRLTPGVAAEDVALSVSSHVIDEGARILAARAVAPSSILSLYSRMRAALITKPGNNNNRPPPSYGAAQRKGKIAPSSSAGAAARRKGKPPTERQQQLRKYHSVIKLLVAYNVLLYFYLHKDMLRQMGSSVMMNNAHEQLAFLPGGMLAPKIDRGGLLTPSHPRPAAAKKQNSNNNLPFVKIMMEGLCDDCKAAEVKGGYTCEDRIERYFKKGGDFSAFVKAQDDVSKEYVKKEKKISCAACDPKTCKIAM